MILFPNDFSLHWVPMLTAFGALTALACEPVSDFSAGGFVGMRTTPIIEGRPAPQRSAVVRIEHRDRAETCSGTAVASSLVLTAKHCVFSRGVGDDAPLSTDGFRVAFGPNDEQYELRFVESVDWIDKPDAPSVADSVAAGEDVALLRLSEDVPEGTALASVQFDYEPTGSDDLVIVGFGLSSIETGVHGERLEASVVPSGFEAATGILQVDGPSACFGDSGGPVLLEPQETVVGVLGQVGGSTDASFCDIDRSFAATVANSRVRRFLRSACGSSGGCGPRVTLQDGGRHAEAGMEGGVAGEQPAPFLLADGAAHDSAAGPKQPSASAPRLAARGGCSVQARDPQRAWFVIAALGVLLLRRYSSPPLRSRSGKATESQCPRKGRDSTRRTATIAEQAG